jgi:sugar lactone lactonase YvrE
MYFAAGRRSLIGAVIALTLPLGSAAQAVEPPTHGRGRISTAFALPGDRVYPEGITADPHTGDFYTGSYQDGTIFKTARGQRVAKKFLPAGAAGRTGALGLEVDRARRLWVIDAATGVVVYDIPSRRLLARFSVPGENARLVNDLAITPDGTAYVTDSLRSVVYRVTPRQLEKARDQGGEAPLTAAFDLTKVLEPHEPGTVTLNGIVAAPSGRYLLAVDMGGGDLYRLDRPTGRINKVALHGGNLAQADGMELHHGTLWAAHPIPAANAISRWRISSDGRAAWLSRRIIDQDLQLPTTLMRKDGRLYVVRSQFDKGGPVGPGTPQIPFTVAAVHGV